MASFAKWGNDLYSGDRSYDIVGTKRRWFLIGLAIVIISAALLVFKGLNPGIEFRGGSEFTVSGAQTLDQSLAQKTLDDVAPGQVAQVTVVGGDSLRVQTESLTESQTKELAEALAQTYGTTADNVSASFVGPTWGQDVTAKALLGLVVFLLVVSLVMTLYFRRWTMAAGALIALMHDVVITVGIYAGVGFEVTPATVIGFLTILGYSLYDTVVVFDKVRENTANFRTQTRFTYAEGANLAINQTMVRSINTSVVGLLPVGSILFVGAFLLGAGTLRDIALALFIGMIFGTYSSIFIATPMQVFLYERNAGVREHNEKVFAARRAVAEAEATKDEDALPVRVGGGSSRPSARSVSVSRPVRDRRSRAERAKKNSRNNR